VESQLGDGKPDQDGKTDAELESLQRSGKPAACWKAYTRVESLCEKVYLMLQEMLEEEDHDKDGVIKWEEFRRMLTNKQKGRRAAPS
jgi:hypothetical protein